MDNKKINQKNIFNVGAVVTKRSRPSSNVTKKFDRKLVRNQQDFFEDSCEHKAFMANLMEIKTA